MKKKFRFIAAGMGVLICLAGVASGQETVAPEILGWADCAPRVVRIELVEKLETSGRTLTAGRRDAVLALVKIEGKAPRAGFLSVAPHSFGAQFLYRGMIKMEISKAWGIRGKNVDTGESVDSWESNPDVKANIGVEDGEKISVWFAVAVPKEVSSFYVIVPSLLEARADPGE